MRLQQTLFRDLAASFARGLSETSALANRRAQGRPGACCTRGLACDLRKQNCTRAYRAAGASRPSLRNGFTAYFVLFPENGSFASVAPAKLSPLGDLTPAPRRPNHTTSPYASCATSCAFRVHRIPPHDRDVRERPSLGETGGVMPLICPTWKAEYFRFAGLTRFRKIRSDLGVGRAGRDVGARCLKWGRGAAMSAIALTLGFLRSQERRRGHNLPHENPLASIYPTG
jgi:hypothetical protein